MHGGAPGSGAPRGNKNALKHGAYTREAIERRRLARRGCLLRDRCLFSGMVALELSSAAASLPRQE